VVQRIGRFEVLDELGRGAMGTVYRARDPSLDRLVALKTIAPAHLTRPDSLARFQREARAIARLAHPNIVTIFEMGEDQGGFYIAMELLGGVDLAQAMMPAGRLTLARKVEIVIGVGEALQYAHEHGVVHRDVKPGNIRVLPEGGVKVVDFGIARLADSEFTQTGLMMGTPSYMAPEVLSAGQVDHRTDIWALGVILYELLAGRRPYEAPTIATLCYRIVHEPPPPLDVAALGSASGLANVVAHALARDPTQRYAQMSTMVAALRAVMAGERVAAPTDTQPAPRVEVVAPPVPAAKPPGTDTLELLRTRGAAAFRDLGVFGEPPATKTACISPEGDRLATAGADGAIRVWDLQARNRALVLRTEMHRRTGHDAIAICLAFRNDGIVLASGHVDGAVHIWDMRTGDEVPGKLRHEQMVAAVAFSPDGATLASGGLDSNLKLWDLRAAFAGEARREMHRQPSGVTGLAYVAGGAHIVTGHVNRVLRVQESQTGRLVATIRGPEAAIGLLSPAPDGHTVAVAAQDKTVRVFDTTARTQTAALTGHRRPPTGVAFFPGGTHLASVAQENLVHLWDVTTGTLSATLWGPTDEGFCSVELWSHGDNVAVALTDGRIRLWGPAQ
jgi:hypothetical protein